MICAELRAPASTGPRTAGRAQARTSVLPEGQNLDAGRIHSARADEKIWVPTKWDILWEGGMRASIYNAMPTEGVEKLCDFIKAFDKNN